MITSARIAVGISRANDDNRRSQIENMWLSLWEVICHKIPWIRPRNVHRAKCMLMVNPSQVALEGDLRDLAYQKFPQHFVPQYPHTNSPYRYPYISLKDQLREFEFKKFKAFSH